MRRFITLATIALIVAAVVKQRQRVSELGRQALSGRTTPEQWQRVQGLTRQVLSRGTEKISVSAEENKTIAQRFNEDVWGRGDEDALEELLAPDFIDHDPLPGQSPDREGHRQILAAFRSAFPDLHVTTEDVVAEGDKVVSRWTARGTHQGDLMGIAPTGNRITIKGIDVLRTAEGRIVERWAQFNNLEVMQQLGVVPDSGQERVEPSH